jgi:hypothetical protein
LDSLDGKARSVGDSPAVDRQLAEVDEQLAAIEEILLEEYVEPQPLHVTRLRPVHTPVREIPRSGILHDC